MKSRRALTIHQMAKEYGVRPSELLGIDDPVVALDLDIALMFLGDRDEARREIRAQREAKTGSVRRVDTVRDFLGSIRGARGKG